MRQAIKKHPIVTAIIVTCFALSLFSIYIFKSTSAGRASVALPIGEKIAILEINGGIFSSKEIIENIESAKKNQTVKGVVLRVNSPGGAVSPSQEIYSEVRKLAKEKKVVASLASIAASGGYYVACGAEKIVANPGTLTGSIGVIMDFSNMEGLLEKVGLKNYVIKSGKFKDVGSPVREMTPEERAFLQDLIDNVHEQFVNAVADGRKMDKSEVAKVADGRILTGEQALQLGLVDHLGNLQDSIKLVADMAGIKGDPKVFYIEKEKGFFQLLKGRTLVDLINNFSIPQLMYMSDLV